jgi:hypothetical protein
MYFAVRCFYAALFIAYIASRVVLEISKAREGKCCLRTALESTMGFWRLVRTSQL